MKTNKSELHQWTNITASELVSNIKVGYNIGNQLDAIGCSCGIMGEPEWIKTLEEAWDNPAISREYVNGIRRAGFNAVRIPVSWAKVCDIEYNIRKEWVARVREVVDYAVASDLYIILNTHHDEEVFKLNDNNMAETRKAFIKIWKQISDEFKNYNEKLIFEALNEPRVLDNPNQWRGGSASERRNINTLNQLFVNIIRASGVNNRKRILMIKPQAAFLGNIIALDDFIIPKDSVKNRLILGIHLYVPQEYTELSIKQGGTDKWNASNSDDTRCITTAFNAAKCFSECNNNIPIILSEFGATNKYTNHDVRHEYAEYIVKEAKERDIKCFWWDGGVGMQLFNRITGEMTFPLIVKGLMQGTEKQCFLYNLSRRETNYE
jgi:endoglucanase